jgi:hypothetical protein
MNEFIFSPRGKSCVLQSAASERVKGCDYFERVYVLSARRNHVCCKENMNEFMWCFLGGESWQGLNHLKDTLTITMRCLFFSTSNYNRVGQEFLPLAFPIAHHVSVSTHLVSLTRSFFHISIWQTICSADCHSNSNHLDSKTDTV